MRGLAKRAGIGLARLLVISLLTMGLAVFVPLGMARAEIPRSPLDRTNAFMIPYFSAEIPLRSGEVLIHPVFVDYEVRHGYQRFDWRIPYLGSHTGPALDEDQTRLPPAWMRELVGDGLSELVPDDDAFVRRESRMDAIDVGWPWPLVGVVRDLQLYEPDVRPYRPAKLLPTTVSGEHFRGHWSSVASFFVGVALPVWFVLTTWRLPLALWRASRGRCPRCGYMVAGAVGPCPECGRPVRRGAVV